MQCELIADGIHATGLLSVGPKFLFYVSGTNQWMDRCQPAHHQRGNLHGNANQWILIDVIDQVCLNRCFVLYRYKKINTMNVHISFTMMSHPFLSDPGSGPISLDTVYGILEFFATT